jgi:hypothetical protein
MLFPLPLKLMSFSGVCSYIILKAKPKYHVASNLVLSRQLEKRPIAGLGEC